jgi:3D (Asp-Asp-Asp) domain-containing protein
MRLTTIALAAMLFTSCSSTIAVKRSIRRGWSRVTFYNPHEVDKMRYKRHGRWHTKYVRWGRRTASGVTATEGVTCAAGPAIPIGTKVEIPQLKGLVGDGIYTVQDRGAGYKLLRDPNWIDVFVSNKYKMRQLQYGQPEYMEVHWQ